MNDLLDPPNRKVNKDPIQEKIINDAIAQPPLNILQSRPINNQILDEYIYIIIIYLL